MKDKSGNCLLRTIGVVAMLFSMLALPAYIENADTVLDLMDKAMEFDTMMMDVNMSNTDRLGTTTLTFRAWERSGGDALLEVTQGPDRGQKILRLSDDIYIYYPDADEIIRLSNSGKKNSFLGSGFSYEDLTGDDDYKKRYESVIEDVTEASGHECYKILMKARKNSEAYQMIRAYVDAELFIPHIFEMYSKSGKLLKTIYYTDWSKEEDIWFAGTIRVEDAVKSGTYSVMTIAGRVVNTPLESSLFSKSSLSW